MSHIFHRKALPSLASSSPPASPTVLRSLTVAILIVSTTAAKDPTTDSSGQLLRDFFTKHPPADSLTWELVDTRIVSDDVDEIKTAVRDWTDSKSINLIATTGGTGFAVSDQTPEAVKDLLQKEAPGLVHAMLAASLNITPFAMMARPVAGVCNSTVIITLPGSPKGAQENLASVIKLLPHACIQASGSTSSRALHSGGISVLEKSAGIPPRSHHHHHHHHHHAPKPHTARANKLSDSVTQRHRESPYPLLSVADATAIIARETPLSAIISVPVNPDLVGHVLAEDVTAPESVPAYRASIVDGYAVVHSDGAGIYPVVSVSHAAPGTVAPLRSGEISRITTGAPLPPGATAVVMVEDTALKATTEDGGEEHKVEILAEHLRDGENVREIGSDVMAGDVVLKQGDIVSAVGGEIGVLASVGLASVKVYKKPTVGVLSTGDEVINHDREGALQPGEIRDSNRPALLSAIRAWGFPTLDLGITGDQPGALETTLREALEAVDIVITTGGVSMGELDLLKPTIEQSLQGTIHFGRVAMKPGKPTTFATIPSSQKLIFALPGNPASTLVTFHLFVLPALRKTLGMATWQLPRVAVTIDHDFYMDQQRPEYHRVRVAFDRRDGKLHASSTGAQRSSRVASASRANAVVCLPSGTEVSGKRAELGVVPAGETVDAILWGQVDVRV